MLGMMQRLVCLAQKNSRQNQQSQCQSTVVVHALMQPTFVGHARHDLLAVRSSDAFWIRHEETFGASPVCSSLVHSIVAWHLRTCLRYLTGSSNFPCRNILTHFPNSSLTKKLRLTPLTALDCLFHVIVLRGMLLPTQCHLSVLPFVDSALVAEQLSLFLLLNEQSLQELKSSLFPVLFRFHPHICTM